MSGFFNRAFFALLKKELLQIVRDRQILAMLLITPTLQLLLFGYALSPEVKHLRLSVLDLANSPSSRELTAALARDEVFDVIPTTRTIRGVHAAVQNGEVDAAVIMPPEMERRLKANRPVQLQVLLNGVDANTAGIAAAYVSQILIAFNQQLAAQMGQTAEAIRPAISFVFNPGLLSSWFFVPGVIAMSLNVAGTLVSSATLLREKETGTIEQLLMAPANASQIMTAKILPLILVLSGVVLVSTTLAQLFFQLPIRGSFIFFFAVSLLYMFVLIALGLALASFAQNQRQAMLSSFFITMPLIQLSGALSPIETMPPEFQMLSLLDPLRFYITCTRGILLKGNGIAELYPEMLALLAFAVVLMGISTNRFRKQLQ